MHPDARIRIRIRLVTSDPRGATAFQVALLSGRHILPGPWRPRDRYGYYNPSRTHHERHLSGKIDRQLTLPEGDWALDIDHARGAALTRTNRLSRVLLYTHVTFEPVQYKLGVPAKVVVALEAFVCFFDPEEFLVS